MTVTIEVPESVVERAAELGVPVDELVLQAVGRIAPEDLAFRFVPLGNASMAAEAAADRMLELRKGQTLGGLNIKELIDAGRP